MAQDNNAGSIMQRIFSALTAVLFVCILTNALITLVKTKEMTNVLTIVVTMLFVIVMVLDKKDLFATIGIGCYALWKIVTFFLGGSMTAMWFDLAAAVVLLYLTFLVSRRDTTAKDLHTVQIFGWIPGLLAIVGFYFYLSYACNGIPMRYWIYSIENGQRINLHYIGLKLIEVLGVISAGLWTAFNPAQDGNIAAEMPEDASKEQQEIQEQPLQPQEIAVQSSSDSGDAGSQ